MIHPVWTLLLKKKAVKKLRIYFYNIFFFNFQQKMYLLH